MIELHTHTVYSDGRLVPAALARQARLRGYRAVALTDHADWTNYTWILHQQLQSLSRFGLYSGIDICVGLELTHVPPPIMAELVQAAREAGAQIVLVHGESPADAVETGTNLAAIEAGVDVLAHPGLIGEQEAALAAERGVLLEISGRSGHCLTNGHVVDVARKCGAGLVLGSDVHAAGDLPERSRRRLVALGAGMTEEEFIRAETAAQDVLQGAITRQY